MTLDQRRITLIARHKGMPLRDWDMSNPVGGRLIFLDSVSFLPYSIHRGIHEYGQDIERVIIDRTGTAIQFLELLSSLPQEFRGDALFVRTDGAGFLSSVGRGGDRVMYSLSRDDVEFYLKTQGIVWATTAGAQRAAA